MEYSSYAFLYPPRPEVKVPRGALSHYERLGWHAQVKKNGTCTVIFARGDEVIFKTRHDQEGTQGDNHKMWTPKSAHVEFFQKLPALDGGREGWNVFVAELLHSKTPKVKDQLYIFDQIVSDGVHLVGRTFTERQAMLRKRWPTQVSERNHLRIGEHVVLAKNYKSGFDKLFDTLQVYGSDGLADDEGLVIKKPDAPLVACFKELANQAWQIKARVPHKNYSF